MKYLLPLFFMGLLKPAQTFSQPLSKKEIASTVITVADLIQNNYVFPSKGKIISENLLQEYKKGKFNQVKNWEALSTELTTYLQYLSSDNHLYAKNDPKTVQELANAKSQETTSDSSSQFKYDPFYYGKEAIEKNFGFSEIKILDENIGYIKLSEINISDKSLPVLFAAMQFVANSKSLIIDLRDNGGGGSDVGAVFESFFLAKDISLLEFKSRNGQSQINKTVPWLIEKKYDNPLFIIVNKNTASAAEAFAFSLQKNKRALIIGQKSAGAANMNSWYVVNDYIFLSVSTASPTIPRTEESWEQIGIRPNHIVEIGKEIEFIRNLLK